MITHPELYTRDSVGNIRIWFVEQDDEKYRFVSGLSDGEKVRSEWTFAKAKNQGKKNETNSIEQAEKEILAKYKKQKKTGYFENVKDIDNFLYVEPMLAKLYKNYAEKINFKEENWILQTKFNGMRCLATKNGLFTRKGEKYISCPHIEESLSSFFEEHPNAVLDGELFNYDLRQQLNEISKLIRKTVHISEEDFERSKKLVSYFVYDGYGFGIEKNDDYQIRKKWIDENLNYNHISKVQDFEINDEDDLFQKYQELIEDGHEGAILRKKNMKYEHKRSKELLKVKPEDDDEALITDIKEGTGNWSGAGKIISLDWNGKKFDASFKGSYEEGVDFLKNKNKWLGKKVTFLYNGLTGKGTPNFARVDINNCVKADR